MLALPGIAQAGELTYSAGVLTYTGGDAVDNNVSATHQGNLAQVRIVDAADNISIGSGTGCAPDDIDFGVICPTPGKLVVNLGGGDDFFTDDNTLGDPIAFPVEVNGGAGNDEFDGGRGADVLTGRRRRRQAPRRRRQRRPPRATTAPTRSTAVRTTTSSTEASATTVSPAVPATTSCAVATGTTSLTTARCTPSTAPTSSKGGRDTTRWATSAAPHP